MVMIQAIIDKIKETLQLEYPESTIYIQGIPADVQRPSFQIYLDTDRSEDNNLRCTNETSTIGITYFAPEGDEILDNLKQLGVYDRIKGIFRSGCIEVGDRKLKITLLRGGRQDREIFINVKLVYTDERPQDEVEYNLMREIKIN